MTASSAPVSLCFDRGTIVLLGDAEEAISDLPGVLWDPRSQCYRAPAYRYGQIAATAAGRGLVLRDEVSQPRSPAPFATPDLRPYQLAAIASWSAAGRRGVVVLPTGAGKTRVALAVMAELKLATLCLVPTRVLLHQWHEQISAIYAGAVGILGDGQRSFAPVTVATFESALRAASWLGNRFELLIADEVHHFGHGSRDEALEMCVARARLGLTATPPDGAAAARLTDLVGPTVVQVAVSELTGTFLAELELCVIRVALDADERLRWDADHARFRAFYREFSRHAPGARFDQFVAAAMKTDEGRAAVAAWRRLRRLVAWTRGKERALTQLLRKHRDARILIFTADNDTAYDIARKLLIMPITCDIRKKERSSALEAFAVGKLNALVSARVLNEGIDVPDADVGIVVGGTQGAREHVQRVGRLLRPRPGKRATVYELVTVATHEARQSAQRGRGLVHASDASL